MKFCPDCGFRFTSGTEKFCPNCGYDVNNGVVADVKEKNKNPINIENTVGDVFGVGVSGSGNIIGKGITINQATYHNLETEFRNSLDELLTIINRDNKTLAEYQKRSLDESINSLAKEAEGLKPEEVVLDKEKKDEIRSKQITLAEKIVNYSPKVAESIALATPLAPFSKVIGEGTGFFAEWIHRKLGKKKT